MPRSPSTDSTAGPLLLPTLFREAERKARRNHRCFECQTKIKKGEEYTHISGKWEGNFRTYRLCNSCFEVHQVSERSEDAAFGNPQKAGDFRLIHIPAHWHHNAHTRDRFIGEWLTIPRREVAWFTRHVLRQLREEGKDPMDFPRPPQRPTRYDHLNWEPVKIAC